ncbi:MAG: hypothetical protein JST40_11070 [Armatimonadetes bacterium]|nr:hypothetical protein [Armatimonadota bacterium]
MGGLYRIFATIRRMTFEQAVDALSSLNSRGWKLGLERMREICHLCKFDRYLGPETPKYFHVAGTNGKGSVTANLYDLLTATGARTGGFFSPYVVDVRERVQAEGEMISESAFAEGVEWLLEKTEPLIHTPIGGPTEFELKTALGFWYWHRHKCECVAMEVGLGGRLDCTNVVMPAASIIASIGLDHMAILGDTLEKIAFEKAGIIKDGAPVIVGRMDEVALSVIEARATENNVPLWRLGKDFEWEDAGDGKISLSVPELGISPQTWTPRFSGERQKDNYALSLVALASGGISLPSPQEVRPLAILPGRFDVIRQSGRTFIIDGAHNLPSAENLASELRRCGYTQCVLVTQMLSGHAVQDFYAALAPLIGVALVPPIDYHRSQSPNSTVSVLNSLGVEAEPMVSVESALTTATRSHPEWPIVITGSFYLAGECHRWLRNRPSDPPTKP